MSAGTLGQVQQDTALRIWNETTIRMQCIEIAKGLTNNPSQNAEDVVSKAKTLAKWVLTGKTGKEEE